MPTVRLSDCIVPEVFAQYLTNDTVVQADVFNSGIVSPDPLMNGLLTAGGRVFQHPVWGDLDNSDPVQGSDDPAITIGTSKIGTFKHQFVRQTANKAWQTADLAKELAGSDPAKRISSRVSAYWARNWDRYTIDTITGMINSNIANNAGDMVYDITAKTGTITVGAATTPAYAVNAGAVMEARQTMGDKQEMLSIIIMHSRVLTNLKIQNQIAYIPNATGVVNIPTYQNMRVVTTDNMPVTVSGADLIYTTYIVAPGVIGWTEKPVDIPVEVYREPLKGNGSGIETLTSRQQFALHPYGFNWTDASCAGVFPTRTELRLAANWTRAFPERKQINVAVLLSKNG
jgi:hypothetical protein